uniref:Uncharacterized protein n=1 Tax=Arundo donax TaxID=35708 RepID=A0A0A9DYP6_ARUDO
MPFCSDLSIDSAVAIYSFLRKTMDVLGNKEKAHITILPKCHYHIDTLIMRLRLVLNL